MVALPKTILASIRTQIYPSKYFTRKQFKQAFARNGYGQQKTIKWLQYFLDNEILITDDDGETFTCTLW